MIKIFDATDRNFATNGNIAIDPIKCIENKKKSLNGWELDVEVSIKYAEYIKQDKLCVVQTKSKLNPQAFRIKEIQTTTRKVKFKARHVMFDAEDYFLLDVRPTNQGGQATLTYINSRTDKTSPFTVYSNVTHTDTAYFVRKSLLEAWLIIEERWGGVFDADNWNISFLNHVGNDNGETIAYKDNLQGIEIYEDWSNVVTKICPVGYDGLLLPEIYLEADIQYEQPYTRKVEFDTEAVSLQEIDAAEKEQAVNKLILLKNSLNNISNSTGRITEGYEDVAEDYLKQLKAIMNLDYTIKWLIDTEEPDLYMQIVNYEQINQEIQDMISDIKDAVVKKVRVIEELRQKAQEYLDENKYPKVSYEIISNIKQTLEIGDTIHVKHPLVNILTEVLEYDYNITSKKVKRIVFGNYDRNVQTKFNSIKETINKVSEVLSTQEVVIQKQTDMINNLNKFGYVYIDDNEILILDRLPKEEAVNVWRWGLGGLGFSSNGYEGPFTTAITQDGQINANFITTGQLEVSVIRGLTDTLSQYSTQINLNKDNITSIVEKQDEFEDELSSRPTRTQMNSAISQTASSIRTEVNRKVDSSDFGTLIEQNYQHVRIAWNNISQYIQFENAQLNIYDSSNLKLLSLNNTGMNLYASGTKIGNMALNNLSGQSNIKGLNFELDMPGYYMSWSRKTSSSSDYYMALTYSRANGAYSEDGLHLGVPLYTHGQPIYFDTNKYVRTVGYSNGAAIRTTSQSFYIEQSNGSPLMSFSSSGIITIHNGSALKCYRDIDMGTYNISNCYIRDRWPITNSDDITIDYFNFVYQSNPYLEMLTASYGAYGINVWASDGRMKKNIAETEVNALEVINKIEHRQFNWKDGNIHEEIGYIAQEMEEIKENFVFKVPQKDKEGNIVDYRYQINETKIIPYLSKAIQELSEKINYLYEKVGATND